MKNILKLILIALLAMFFFACETDDEDNDKDTADIQISNLSNNPAKVYIYNSGSSSYLQDTIPANGSKIVTVEDGTAGLNVNGGRAIIDYRHVINSEEVDVISSIYADLSISTTAFVQIDNEYGCLDIESYSQSDEMWVSIDFGLPEIIPAWSDLTKFYDPPGLAVNKFIEYNGYTLFAGEINITVVEDDYSRLDIYPDAGCFRINNTSTSFVIEEVYLSPSTETTWGTNDLMFYIDPGEFYTWTCTSDMEWDLKVVDDWEDEFTFFNINMGTDDVYTYNYDGFRASKNPNADQDKITNAKNAEITVTSPRCEANDRPASAITISSVK